MNHQKISLEIPDLLMQKLEKLAQASDQSTESLMLSCITRCLPQIEDDINRLEALLVDITPESLHEEIDFGEPVGREFR